MHAADYMHDVTVALDGAIRFHANTAGACDTPQVVTSQVDEHDVLRVFLGIAAQLRLPRNVCGHVVRAGTSAGDGTQLRTAVFQFDQRFGRRTNHCYITKGAVVHVGRRIDEAQCAVRLEWVELMAAGKFWGEDTNG